MSMTLILAAIAAVLCIAYMAYDRKLHPNRPRPRMLFTIGNNIMICEDPNRPDMNWYGTVLGRENGTVIVRDNETMNVANVDKAYVFPYDQKMFDQYGIR